MTIKIFNHQKTRHQNFPIQGTLERGRGARSRDEISLGEGRGRLGVSVLRP